MSIVTSRDERRALADALPDTPETVISIHLLRRGLCRAHLVGTLERFDALVIDSDEAPGEPTCFGDDPDAIVAALGTVANWWAVNVPEHHAEAIGRLIAADVGATVRYLGDIYHTLDRPVTEYRDRAVRLLTFADHDLLDAAPPAVRGGGYGGARALLENGIAAAAIVDGRLVAIAHTSAQSDRYADIGVATLEGFRGRGYATAAASLVAGQIQASGRTPVWSCGETNIPSLSVAERLGFEPISRRVYVIVERAARCAPPSHA